jgi:hypothetical protein
VLEVNYRPGGVQAKRSRLYHLSEAAYDGLARIAERQGYALNNVALRGRGISKLLDAVGRRSPQDFIDARPDWQREADDDLLAAGRHKDWASPEPYRWGRRLSLLPTTENTLILVAERLDCVNNRRDDSSAYNRNSLVAMVLEAMGLGWITLADWPLAPRTNTQRKARAFELDW